MVDCIYLFCIYLFMYLFIILLLLDFFPVRFSYFLCVDFFSLDRFIYKLCKTTMTMMSYIKSNKFDLFAHQIQQLDALKSGSTPDEVFTEGI
jgi:hypothetical protein